MAILSTQGHVMFDQGVKQRTHLHCKLQHSYTLDEVKDPLTTLAGTEIDK